MGSPIWILVPIFNILLSKEVSLRLEDRGIEEEGQNAKDISSLWPGCLGCL